VPATRLLISCADRHGIVAAVSAFLFEEGANIVSSDQHTTDPEGGRFFMRMEFTLDGLEDAAAFEERFAELVGRPLEMDWRMASADRRKRVALLASRDGNCLLDLLWRWQRGELHADVALVVSNHRLLEEHVAGFGVPFVHVPVTPETKPEAERELLGHLRGYDVAVLARYMQFLSGGFLDALGLPVINIHHSFLPAFAGADPYRRAHERGVKIIGATAHYVTEELDAGPIIEQDVVRTTHRATVADLARMGADIERVVLARAVQWHLQDRVLVDGNKTIVFG
jgi:formyltetrahydrofolate deformylase